MKLFSSTDYLDSAITIALTDGNETKEERNDDDKQFLCSSNIVEEVHKMIKSSSTQTEETGAKRPSVVFSLANNNDTILEVQGFIFFFRNLIALLKSIHPCF